MREKVSGSYKDSNELFEMEGPHHANNLVLISREEKINNKMRSRG